LARRNSTVVTREALDFCPGDAQHIHHTDARQTRIWPIFEWKPEVADLGAELANGSRRPWIRGRALRHWRAAPILSFPYRRVAQIQGPGITDRLVYSHLCSLDWFAVLPSLLLICVTACSFCILESRCCSQSGLQASQPRRHRPQTRAGSPAIPLLPGGR
jgi:hypothetical protein